ncbi:protein of unknown function [Devosia enhydra]|uniref:DUF4326 domain-containing protein n=1 Tax=Devosia enhydra TaxID=665118 RepID=A0A1K2HWB0_9HYPH|nr:DUF4326 domain-containing protein [Devosia enhydra]SFZ83284.1 protein of unknown function [Devosia enhydra]
MTPAQPQRLVLSRRRGFDLQAISQALNGLPAKRVSRPGPWGNPFTIEAVMAEMGLSREAAQARAVEAFGRWIAGLPTELAAHGQPPSRETIRAALAGHNLACWCAAGTPCHADILIAIANSVAPD